MDSELKRQIILDNYQDPYNKGLVNDNSYLSVNTSSESCIDNLDFMMKVEGNIIKDIRFDGEACVICISSCSVMNKLLIGKTYEEALNIIDNYFKMINEEEYDPKVLEEALIYDEIYKQPSRKKCATLTWNGAKEVLDKNAN